MTFIRTLQELSQADIPIAGGKGANLGELIRAGFPTPPGFVLTTAAYDLFVAENDLEASILHLARQVRQEDPTGNETIADQIGQLLLEAPIPPAIIDALQAARAALEAETTAVRSSATAENLPTASFAGQQESFLNVAGGDDLLAAVKGCWASLWTARAMVYRARQGIEPAHVSMAVVVQAMAPAHVSGILFTANPTTGARDELMINASFGLGEAIVSGAVTPDSYVLERESRTILQRTIGHKEVMVVAAQEQQTTTQAVPMADRRVAALSDGLLKKLAILGIAVEGHFGGVPQDIEWAVAGETIWLLQSRPITNLPPAPLKEVRWEPIVPNTVWMRRQIVEHMPEPLSPLFEDLYLQQGLDHSTKELMHAMAEVTNAPIDLDAMMPYGFAGTINGYAYTSGSFRMSGKNLWAVLKIYSRIFRFFKMAIFDWDGVTLPQYQALIQKWDEMDVAQADDATLLQGLQKLATADSVYWFGSALNLGLSRIMDSLFDRLLRSLLFRSGLPQAGIGSSSFLRGFDSKALDAQADLEALASTIRAEPALQALIVATDAHRLLDVLADHPEGPPILDGIQTYLDAYGHQIYNLDFVVPTQNEDPRPVLLSLKALVQSPPALDVRTRQARMAAQREELVAETQGRLNPLSRRLFRWVWKWTKAYAPYRENVMFYMGAAWPTLRRLAHALGERLVAAGALATADDVYYLNSGEIQTAIQARAAGQPGPDFTDLIQERRILREARKRLTPPPKVPQRSSIQFGPLKLSMFDPTPDDAANRGSVLSGYAVSAGAVTAPASVIRAMEEFGQMQPGTVLVCTTTTPAWTPLFSQAVGLVTNVGGALAHGSIVAREYGIPTVMGTGNATERIRSGMVVTVDGDAGTVTLLDQADLEGEGKAESGI